MSKRPFSPCGSPEEQQRAERSLLAWLRLARVYQKVDRASAERLRQWDLSVAQFDALAQIHAAEGLMQQELANHLLVTKGNISQLLDRLAARGLIARRQEGRTSRLYLTPLGRELIEAVVPAHEAFIAEQFAALCEGERKDLLTTLRRLDHALS